MGVFISDFVNSTIDGESHSNKKQIKPNSLINVTQISSTIWDGFQRLTQLPVSHYDQSLSPDQLINASASTNDSLETTDDEVNIEVKVPTKTAGKANL